MPGYHNRFGLMGGSEYEEETQGTTDRSEVLPFSVMAFDEEEGWQQAGVYATRDEAEIAMAKFAAEYRCDVGIADTNAILDLAAEEIASGKDQPLWDLPG